MSVASYYGTNGYALSTEAPKSITEKVTVQNLDFLLWRQSRAKEHETSTPSLSKMSGDCVHRSIRVWQVNAAGGFSIGCMIFIRTRAPPGMYGSTTTIFSRRHRILICCARKLGMVFQEQAPFPMTISKISPSVFACMSACQSLNSKIRSSTPGARGAVGGSQGQAWRRRWSIALGRPTAAPVHRPHRRGATGEVAILFDEPCSALDPISTAKIEELIDELKDDYRIAIVTHNMQQAARRSDFHRVHVSR